MSDVGMPSKPKAQSSQTRIHPPYSYLIYIKLELVSGIDLTDRDIRASLARKIAT
jgi:hypothetical protein